MGPLGRPARRQPVAPLRSTGERDAEHCHRGGSVAAASKHGSTAEIAAAIARHLTEAGHQVEVRGPEQVRALDGVEAVVLGSAVYAGHRLKEAPELSSRLAPALATRPVWLFSSGPIGDPPSLAEDAVDVATALAATGALDHRTFAGRIDKDRLAFGEHAIVKAPYAAVGDFRDWDAIADWIRSIETMRWTTGKGVSSAARQVPGRAQDASRHGGFGGRSSRVPPAPEEFSGRGEGAGDLACSKYASMGGAGRAWSLPPTFSRWRHSAQVGTRKRSRASARSAPALLSWPSAASRTIPSGRTNRSPHRTP